MATTQNFNYPSSSDVTVTGIGNPIGQPYPTSAVPIAGENPAGLLTPIQTNTAGDLIVTQAAGSIDNVNLSEVGGSAVTLGAKVSASSIPVVLASDETVPVSAVSLPLPTGASTSALQTTGNTSLSSILANQTNGTQETQIVGTVPLPTGSATAALQSSVQGSPTGGTAAIASSLDGGIYNSTAPTLTSGQQAALQLNNQGSLYTAAGPDFLTATQSLTVRDTGTTSTVGSDGQIIYTGTPTAGSSASFSVNSKGSARVQVSGTWTGTIQSEISFDGGTTWYQNSVHVTGTPVNSSSFSGNVGAFFNTAGASNYRMRMVAPSTGTAVVQVNESNSASAVAVLDPIKVVDGTANSTNLLTIKAASTAPVVGDPAVVVSLSPNSVLPLPTGGATSANQTNGLQVSAIGGTVIANSPIQNVYSSTNITTAAYVQLVASTTNVINTLHVFDSSGQAMTLGIGASGSEVTTLYVPPGGDTYTLHIPAGSRLAYKALTANATAGYLLMSFLE